MFCGMYRLNAKMEFEAPKAPHLKSEDQAHAKLGGLAEMHRTLPENILEAQQWQMKLAGGKEIMFDIADKVWLSTKHFPTTRPSEKLDYKCAGQYTVSKVINKNAYEFDLPKTIQNDNIFQVSQLDRYTPLDSGHPSIKPRPMIVDDSEDWAVDCIINSKQHYRNLHCVIQWAGYRYVRTIWEPAETLGNAEERVDEFHLSHPRKLR